MDDGGKSVRVMKDKERLKTATNWETGKSRKPHMTTHAKWEPGLNPGKA